MTEDKIAGKLGEKQNDLSSFSLLFLPFLHNKANAGIKLLFLYQYSLLSTLLPVWLAFKAL